MTRFNPRHIQDAFSRAAPTYQANAELQYDLARQSVIALQSRLKTPNPVVLDAGAGTGNIAAHVAALKLDWNLFALDIAQPMCRLAARRHQHVIRGDITRLPIAPQSVDAVISSLALQWIDDPARAFEQLAQAARPGGWAVLTTFGPGTLAELATAFQSIDGNPRVIPFVEPGTLADLAGQAGWKAVKIDLGTRQTQHQNLTDLMRSLKAIGATDHRAVRNPGLTTPALFRQAALLYPRNRSDPDQITATWRSTMLTLQKS
jgi:malonyl-CoA O-methyltransferase